MIEKIKPLTNANIQNAPVVSNDYHKIKPYLKELPDIDKAFSKLFQRFPIIKIYKALNHLLSYSNYSKLDKDLIDDSLCFNRQLVGFFFDLAATLHQWKGIKHKSVKEALEHLKNHFLEETLNSIKDLVFLQNSSLDLDRETLEVFFAVQYAYIELLLLDSKNNSRL